MEDRVLYKSKYSELVSRTVEGKSHEFEVLKLRPAVAGFIVDKAWRHILLVKQYRPAADKVTWEIPAGMMDKDGETPVDCLVREIKEECNLDLLPPTLTLQFEYYPMIGWSDHKVSIYMCMVSGELKNTLIKNDDSVTETRWFSVEEIVGMLRKHEIIDGKTLLAAETFMAVYFTKQLD